MTDLQLRDLSLRIRPSVAIREYVTASGTLLYLSLFDDEVDERSGRFVIAMKDHQGQLALAASFLELTDAIILQTNQIGTLVVRGGACTVPIFWTRENGIPRLTTHLPLTECIRFSRKGFAASFACVSLHGSYEPNACIETPLDRWYRVRRGMISTFHGELVHEKWIPAPEYDASTSEPDAIGEIIRNGFDAYHHSQRSIRSSVLELSGGFDSTLAGAGAIRPGHTMHGVSVEFPRYEFRFEAPLQCAVADALCIDRTALNGNSMLPYAPWRNPPRFDEPSVFVTGIRHSECVAEFAASRRATRIYVGHGGDQLFSTDLTTIEATPSFRLSDAPFSREFRYALKHSIETVCSPEWRHRSSACFVYDARQDIWVKETFGPTIRTPFTDTAIFCSAQQWSRYSRAHQTPPDKTILARALGRFLPDAVLNRKGKVAYDGVWMESYTTHADHISSTFERTAAILRWIGISPEWLIRRVRQLAAWQEVSYREILGAYAIAVWLLSWNLEDAKDACL